MFIAARAFSRCGGREFLFGCSTRAPCCVASLVAEHAQQPARSFVRCGCSSWALGHRLSQHLWRMGLVAQQHVGSSQVKNRAGRFFSRWATRLSPPEPLYHLPSDPSPLEPVMWLWRWPLRWCLFSFLRPLWAQ